MNEVTDAALSSAKEAVSLCITMAGIVAMWVGVMGNRQKFRAGRKAYREDAASSLGFFFRECQGSTEPWNLSQPI